MMASREGVEGGCSLTSLERMRATRPRFPPTLAACFRAKPWLDLAPVIT